MSWRCSCSVLGIRISIVAIRFLRGEAKPGSTMGAVDKRRMCPNCRAFVTTSDRVCPYCQAPMGPRAIEQRNPGEILGGLIPQARFTTVMILLINTGLFLAQQLNPHSGLTEMGESLPAPMM